MALLSPVLALEGPGGAGPRPRSDRFPPVADVARRPAAVLVGPWATDPAARGWRTVAGPRFGRGPCVIGFEPFAAGPCWLGGLVVERRVLGGGSAGAGGGLELAAAWTSFAGAGRARGTAMRRTALAGRMLSFRPNVAQHASFVGVIGEGGAPISRSDRDYGPALYTWRDPLEAGSQRAPVIPPARRGARTTAKASRPTA